MPEDRKAYVRSVSQATVVRQFGLELNYLVEGKDSNGKLAIIHYSSSPGHEPPPHVHEDEDEVFFLLSGNIDAYCGSDVLPVQAGDCLFLPFGKPHAWIIRSPSLQALIITHPARLDRVFREIHEPYLQIEASEESYERALQGEIGKQMLDIAAQHGMRTLDPAQVREQMPEFPRDRLPS